MKNLKIEILHTGTAFDNPEIETARLLRQLADRIENSDPPHILRDSNGNRCGNVMYSPDYFTITEE
jgi:hypothetical protein